MILALALILSLGAPPSSGCRFDRTGERFRNCQSQTASAYVPFFAFAPAGGAGMTAECGCTTNPTSSTGGALTFTRASTAWCEKTDFSWVNCANDKARVSYGDFLSSTLGLVVERAATNTVLRNRDFSNVAWVKTTMTCNKNATGIDGVASSASTCTATAGSAIVAQAATCPASSPAASIFIKRVTGTGTVSVSCNGSVWDTIVPDSNWRRASGAQCSPSTRCFNVPNLVLSGCNSGGIYVKLATSGDAVALDMAQCESASRSTTPIETAGTSATRVKEAPYFSVAIGTPTAVSVFSTGWTSLVNPAGPTAYVTLYQSGGAYLWPFRVAATNMTCNYVGGGTTNVTSPAFVGTAESRTGCRVTAVVANACGAGTCNTSGAISRTLVSGTVQVDVGNWGASSDQTDGVVKNICVDTTFSGCGP